MRDLFVKELKNLAKKNKKIVILAGDIGYKLFDDFISKYPKRFYNCGIAEANMTTVAAGLALKGFLPITYTIATFNVYKTIEQIKIDLCYPNLPSIIVGVGAGLCYSDLGSTHHAIEDLALLSSIPNLKIVNPADPYELKSLMPQLLKTKSPIYLRLGKKGEKNVHSKAPKINLGKWNKIVNGKDMCIIATGNIITKPFNIIQKLNKKEIFPTLISAHTVKPLDEKLLINLFKNFKKIVIIEDHSEIGGLAASISNFYTNLNFKTKFLKINTGKNFIIKSGKQDEAYKMLKMDETSIYQKIFNFNKNDN